LKNKNRNERLEQLSEALFGAPADLSPTEAAEDLEVAGVDREELFARMYDSLCGVAREYRLRQEEVPPLLRKALEDLRKKAGPPRTKEEMDRRADSTISKLLDLVNARLPAGAALSQLAFQASFRNKASGQPEEDRQIIENLERELMSDLENEEKENHD
jgi:hypothetical protein